MEDRTRIVFTNPRNQERFERFKAICDDEGWSFDCSADKNRFWVELGNYSSAGQDFSCAIEDKLNNPGDIYFGKLLDAYCDAYDPEEEADLWSEPTGEFDDEGREIRTGKNGAPHDYEDIVADMRECGDNVQKLAKRLNSERI